jgi:hypothetical protein
MNCSRLLNKEKFNRVHGNLGPILGSLLAWVTFFEKLAFIFTI